jgi:ketosteroid isomerase-like protein
MSSPEQNVELVTSFLGVIRDEGLAAIGPQADRFMHPEVEWSPGVVDFGQTTYRGIDAFREWIRETTSVSGGPLTIQEVRPVGEDCVLALAYIDYRSKDESFYSEYALAVRVEDERLREVRAFVSHAKAAEAVEGMAAGATQRSPGA